MKQENIRELFFYGLFGTITTCINLLVFKFLNEFCGLHYLLSDLVAWAAGVIFAFVTNKIFVFRSINWNYAVWLKEAVEFTSARLLTGAMDMMLMYFAVSRFGFDEWWSKLIVNIIVIIGNFVLSKVWVFQNSSGKRGCQ